MSKIISAGSWLLTNRRISDKLAAKMLKVAGRAAPSITGAIWARSASGQSAGRRGLRLADMPEKAQAMGVLLAISAIVHQQIDQRQLRRSPKSRGEPAAGPKFAKAFLNIMRGVPVIDAINSYPSGQNWVGMGDLALSRAYPKDVNPEAFIKKVLAQLGEAHAPATAATLAIFAMAGNQQWHGQLVEMAASAFSCEAAAKAAERFGALICRLAELSTPDNERGLGLHKLEKGVDEAQRIMKQMLTKNMEAFIAPALLVDNFVIAGRFFSQRWRREWAGMCAALTPSAFLHEPIIWRMAKKNNARAVLNLASWGASVERPGRDGKRAIEVAVEKKRADVFRAALWAGADVWTTGSSRGKSPLDRAQGLLRCDLEHELLAKAERGAMMASATPEAGKHSQGRRKNCRL